MQPPRSLRSVDGGLLIPFEHRPTDRHRVRLDNQVFADGNLETAEPDPADVAGFDALIQRIRRSAAVERAAVEHT
jgi:hypothetical protein